MKEKTMEIKEQLVKDIETVNTPQDVVDIKAKYIGKAGLITGLMKNMKDYSPEERKELVKSLMKLKMKQLISFKLKKMKSILVFLMKN